VVPGRYERDNIMNCYYDRADAYPHAFTRTSRCTRSRNCAEPRHLTFTADTYLLRAYDILHTLYSVLCRMVDLAGLELTMPLNSVCRMSYARSK